MYHYIRSTMEALVGIALLASFVLAKPRSIAFVVVSSMVNCALGLDPLMALALGLLLFYAAFALFAFVSRKTNDDDSDGGDDFEDDEPDYPEEPDPVMSLELPHTQCYDDSGYRGELLEV